MMVGKKKSRTNGPCKMENQGRRVQQSRNTKEAGGGKGGRKMSANEEQEAGKPG